MPRDRRPFPCPHCGGLVPNDARSCPHCGSDAETGWDPDAECNSVELPEDEDSDEAPGAGRPGASGAFIALLVVVALIGVTAFWGPAGLASPYTLLGALVIVALVVHRMRRRRRRSPPFR